MKRRAVTGAAVALAMVVVWRAHRDARLGDESVPSVAHDAPHDSSDGATAVPERVLTARLKELVTRDPAAALELAQHGDGEFPDGSDGAERHWVIVKSLTDLNRFDEARAEARRMRERFPHHALTADVVHHVLDQPAGPLRDP